MQGILTFLVLGFVGFVLFCVYFIFKMLQFVIVSVNLYKKMVLRQDAMLKILIDIRDNTKQFNKSSLIDDADDDYKEPESEPTIYTCNKCGSTVPVGEVCTQCKTFSNINEIADCVCGSCGAAVSEKDKVCSKCGNEIGEWVGFSCSGCGCNVSQDDKKCPQCGENLE